MPACWSRVISLLKRGSADRAVGRGVAFEVLLALLEVNDGVFYVRDFMNHRLISANDGQVTLKSRSTQVFDVKKAFVDLVEALQLAGHGLEKDPLFIDDIGHQDKRGMSAVDGF